jgi:hypothetical protein
MGSWFRARLAVSKLDVHERSAAIGRYNAAGRHELIDQTACARARPLSGVKRTLHWTTTTYFDY